MLISYAACPQPCTTIACAISCGRCACSPSPRCLPCLSFAACGTRCARRDGRYLFTRLTSVALRSRIGYTRGASARSMVRCRMLQLAWRRSAMIARRRSRTRRLEPPKWLLGPTSTTMLGRPICVANRARSCNSLVIRGWKASCHSNGQSRSRRCRSTAKPLTRQSSVLGTENRHRQTSERCSPTSRRGKPSCPLMTGHMNAEPTFAPSRRSSSEGVQQRKASTGRAPRRQLSRVRRARVCRGSLSSSINDRREGRPQ